MDYRNFFGSNFDGWKRDLKDFADSIKGMAAENAPRDYEGNFGFGCKFSEKDPFFANLYHPRTNISVDPSGTLVFEFMLAGFDEKGIHLSFKGDKMILKARLGEGQAQAQDGHYERKAFSLKDIDYREYSVPADRFDQAAVKAVFKNGILTVKIPALDDSSSPDAVKIEIIKEGN
jgi:HSP20 family molecular chaperone IbpA